MDGVGLHIVYVLCMSWRAALCNIPNVVSNSKHKNWKTGMLRTMFHNVVLENAAHASCAQIDPLNLWCYV